MGNPNPKDHRHLDRRNFLMTFALGASAAPLLSLGRSLNAGAESSQAPSLCYSNKRVLRDTDFQYLGAMRVPANGVRMDFSYGQMTGRKVNGRVHLLMSGNTVQNDPVYEFADTGTYNTDPLQAPRMSLVRAWGDIYGNCRKTWDKNGVERTGIPRAPGGMYFNETTQLLYWTYYDSYNVTGIPDWSLGASRLDPNGAAAFGPWRVSDGIKKGPWRCLRVLEHPSGQMLCGSHMQSGNANSPWGPDLWAGQFPTEGTPGGLMAPDLPIQKYITYYNMLGRIASDGSFTGAIRSLRRPGDYFFEPILGTNNYTQIDPTKNGGVGSWTELDMLGGALWIDLPDVHAVMWIGKLAGGHTWYSNAGQGNLNCTHGVPPPIQVTGPVSTNPYPMMIIYDPADLEAVRSGSRVDYTVDPIQLVNVDSRFGIKTAPVTSVGSAKMINGMYLDKTSRRLYMAAPEADGSIPGLFNPLIHVFQIN